MWSNSTGFILRNEIEFHYITLLFLVPFYLFFKICISTLRALNWWLFDKIPDCPQLFPSRDTRSHEIYLIDYSFFFKKGKSYNLIYFRVRWFESFEMMRHTPSPESSGIFFSFFRRPFCDRQQDRANVLRLQIDGEKPERPVTQQISSF
jgi:hypothetical protein